MRTPNSDKISTKKQEKMGLVEELSKKFDKSKAFLLTDYRGLTHQQLETLRKNLKKVQAEMVVAKNTLLKKSMGEKKAKEEITHELNNPTAAFFAFGDEVEAIKALADFIKNTQLPKVKIGISGEQVISESDFKRIAMLPGRNILLATLAARLNSPLTGLHYALSWNMRKLVTVLNNVKSKKQ